MLTISTPKVFVKGGFIFGFAGHFRFGQVLQHSFAPPKYAGGDVAEYMSRDVTAYMRHYAREAGFLKNREGREGAGIALIGFRSRLFLMQDEFEMLETTDNVISIGCGQAYALGAMKALEVLPMAERIQRSLEVSEIYSGGVRGPFLIKKLEKVSTLDVRKSPRNSKGNGRRPGKAAKRSSK
jgi:ATP-dependent protease HslVU (ClpYQ) peptidase subunit